MGLISRVSSRTYRKTHTMLRLTRALRLTYPGEKVISNGLNPAIQAKRPSPAIQTARWGALIVGIWWGNKRYAELKPQREAERAEEQAAVDALLAKEAAAKAIEAAEFAKDSVLMGAK